MIGIKGSLHPVDFDYEGFTKTLDKEMSIILRGAIKIWLQTVLHAIKKAPNTSGDSFPIQTGRAKASLRPVARYIRMALPIKIAPKRPDLTSKGEAEGYFKVEDNKSSPGTYQYSFRWESDVEHFLINEFHSISKVTSITPWKAVVAGKKAADAYIRKEVKARIKKIKIASYIQVLRSE